MRISKGGVSLFILAQCILLVLWFHLSQGPPCPVCTCPKKAGTLDILPTPDPANQQQALSYFVQKYRVLAKEVKRLILEIKHLKPIPGWAIHHARTLPGQASYRPPSCRRPEPERLIVATLNMWNVNEPFQARLQAMANEVSQLKPHVVAFQEVRQYQGVSQLTMLQQTLQSIGLSYQTTYARISAQDVGVEEGLGMLIRGGKIVKSDWIAINSEHAETRLCQFAAVEFDTVGLVHIFNIHITYVDIEQCYETLALADYMLSKDTSGKVPQIVLGDMNAYFDYEWPYDVLTHGFSYPDVFRNSINPCRATWLSQARVLDQLLAPTGPVSASTYGWMHDVWRHHYADAVDVPGYTFPVFTDHQHLMDFCRPDRILIRSGGALVDCDIQFFADSNIGSEGNTVYPSDHRGLVAQFELHPP